jgi:hypothetical protein
MHLDSGEIKAFLDKEMPASQAERASAHIAQCPKCRLELDAASSRAQSVGDRLTALSPSRPASLHPAAAHARLQTRVEQKESHTMRSRIFSPRYRPAWIVLGLILVLGVSLLFSPVRAIANSFLGLFRVQQFTVVQINPGNLPEQLGKSSQLESMFATDVQVSERGETQDVFSAEEASQLSGIAVRLPTSIEGQPALKVSPGGEITFKIDSEHIQSLLAEIGRSDIQLPDGLEGASVQVGMGSAVTAMYGACEFDLEQAQQEGYDPDDPRLPRLPDCTTLAQMPSPTISAPPGLDIPMISEAFLQVLGMSPEEARQIAQTVDWTTTLVIPIPRYGTTYQEVPVDGVSGTLILQELNDHPDQYLLIWVKDGILYALTGSGNASSALRIADSLR